jgi:hypothetical protein
MPTQPPFVSHEADLAREGNLRVHVRPTLCGGDMHDRHAVWSIESAAWPVRSLSLADVTLPADVPRFAGDTEARELQALLFEIRELNERFVGEPQIESFVRINGTPEQGDIIARGRDWGRRYVARRLARPSPRDAGCQYRRFLRLWKELVFFLDQIGLVDVGGGEVRAATVFGQYLGPMCDLIAWSFFEGTWAGKVVWSDEWVSDLRDPPDPAVGEACLAAFGVYRWKASRRFDRILRELAEALAAQETPHGSDDDERARIGLLAEDIAEMRPFLVRNFPVAKAIVTLPSGLYAGFRWDTLDRIGVLHCSSTERQLLEQYEKGVGELSLAIGYDGLLRCSVNWFRDLCTVRAPLPFPPLAVGRVVLEIVHARLYGFFDKIDLEAVCASWRGRVMGPEAEPASAAEEAEVIAASIATSDLVLGTDGRRGRRVVTSLRLSELGTLLERRFGCSARSSKGSEMVFYRAGGRHAFVSRHKSNPLVPAIAIQRMLRKLEIPVHEWLAVTRA